MRFSLSLLFLALAVYASLSASAAPDPATADEAVETPDAGNELGSKGWGAFTHYVTTPARQHYGYGGPHQDEDEVAVELIPGPRGTTGAQGVTGARGATGVVGATGVQGDTGEQGPTGSTGVQGTTGTQGPQGVTGTVGAAGTCAAGKLYVKRSTTPDTSTPSPCKKANPDDTSTTDQCVIAKCEPGQAFVSGSCSSNDGTGKTSAPLCAFNDGSYMVCPSKKANIVGWACSSSSGSLAAEVVCCGAGTCVDTTTGANTCSQGDQCCSTRCRTATDKQCCEPDGTGMSYRQCSDNSDCCSATSTCSDIFGDGKYCCVPSGPGSTCSESTQCCSRFCAPFRPSSQGQCCARTVEPCTLDTDCCDSTASCSLTPFSPTVKQCCLPNTVPCGFDAICCSGKCDSITFRCVS